MRRRMEQKKVSFCFRLKRLINQLLKSHLHLRENNYLTEWMFGYLSCLNPTLLRQDFDTSSTETKLI